MVFAPMHNRYDQFGKQMVRAALEGHCAVETDAEVPAETRRIDLWFMRREARASLPEHLGLLGTIASRAGTLEFFHNTPSRDELIACLIKQAEFRLHLPRRMAAPPLPFPTQWIISSGRPDRCIEGLSFRPMNGWPSGIYEGPPLLWTRLVVVNELPVTRSTLMLRLLGARAVLRQAIAELKALPADAPERMLALPLLVQFRMTVESEPDLRTPEDEEFLMATADIVEMWRQLAVQEGVMQGFKQGLDEGLSKGLKQGLEEGLKQGLEEGREEGIRQGLEEGVKQGHEQGVRQGLERERKLMLRLLRQCFGDQVDSDTVRRVQAASAEQIEGWLERVVAAATLAEVFAD
jgi:flagellar biosynthesis/type III secretory pathway protein FliH